MRYKAICLTVFSLLYIIRSAGALEICGDIKQGEIFLVKDISAKLIIINKNLGEKRYFVSDDGTALIALHRDAPKSILLDSAPGADYVTRYEIAVAPVKWETQRINGVTQSKVVPTSKADMAEIKREQKDLETALAEYSENYYWKNGFIFPLDGKISGGFGNQRIFNGIRKNPHNGCDIAAPEGAEVKASGDGKVVLSGKDYFYTGNMVVIDHGQGLHTIYAHLSKAKANKGDIIKKGDVIGFVGKTGRAKGAHLHWGASLNGVRFDPNSLLDINNKTCRIIDGKYMGDEAEND